MSLYQSFAKGGTFDPVKFPDKSNKILAQGQKQMEGMEKQIQHNAEQTALAIKVDDQNAALDKSRFDDDFELQQMYAKTLAQRKWRNYEIAVNNAKIHQDQKQKDRQALLDLTVSGAKLGKIVHENNKASADKLAESLQLNYGIGRKGFLAIKNAEQSIISNNESLQALLRKLELKGDIPMDVIAKIRRSGGYLNVAVEKNSATRFGQTLLGRIGQRSNEEIKLPGYEKGISLNTAIAANPALTRTVAEELIRQELTLEDGTPRYSTKVMALAGLTGPEGHVQNVLANFDQKANELIVSGEWKDRHKETIEVLKSFMGTHNGTAHPLGPAGIDAAIVYFAGGENASGEQFKYARTRVVNALSHALEAQTISWEQVKGLENYPVKTKGTPKGKSWGRLYETEWNQLEEAGRKFYAAEEADLQLESANLKLEGQSFYNKVQQIVQTENPGPNTITKLIAHTAGRGEHFNKARTYLQAALARGQTAANDAAGKAALLTRAKNGETITSEEIEKWNFSKPFEAEVRALVLKHNDTVPQAGDNGTRERLKFAITAKLGTKIKRTNQWYNNSTHKDAEIMAMKLASGYYQSARDRGDSHADAYTYAVTQIEDKIDTDFAKRTGYFNVKTKNGAQYFAGARPGGRFEKPIEIGRKQIGQELTQNPNLIYTKNYFDPSEIAEKANKGIYREPHRTAMLMQSLSKGKLDAVDIMQAQLQLKRNQEEAEFGTATTPLLPDAYIKRYKKEIEKVGPLAQQLLTSINQVDVNKAYVSSGIQPVNQDSYYNKANNIIENGDPNSIQNTFDGTVSNSFKSLKYNITEVPISEVLQLMQNGHFNRAGNALFDYDSLKEAATESGLGFDAKFSEANQRKLQNIRFKKYGLSGFSHIEFDEEQIQMGESVHQNLNSETIEQATYFRSPAACNIEACAWLKKNKPEIYGGLYK